MAKEQLYTIGEVSKLCNVSAKALRFYDKIGMIAPDKISESGYRYYSLDTILSIPIVKYYKQMGFRLEEMQGLVNGDNYYVVEGSFHNKINELWEQEHAIHNSYIAVKEWYELIQEAKAVRLNKAQEVGMRYVAAEDMCCLEQEFEYHYMDSACGSAGSVRFRVVFGFFSRGIVPCTGSFLAIVCNTPGDKAGGARVGRLCGAGR